MTWNCTAPGRVSPSRPSRKSARRHPGETVVYLIGEDNVAKLDTWHRIADLRRLVEFVVFGRGANLVPHGLRTLQRRLDISPTEIRERIACGASIRYLVPEPVRALIEHHHLYHPQTALS